MTRLPFGGFRRLRIAWWYGESAWIEATTAEQLAAQLDHPNANAIRNYALEVFFGGRTPEDLLSTRDAAEQRRVLEVLVRIDYSVFS